VSRYVFTIPLGVALLSIANTPSRIMADIVKEASHTEAQPPSEAPSLDDRQYNWYHGVFFQATVVGFCAFTAPGLWNAMQSVGAGGQQTPYLVM
jgi:hypothetical protein